jgi:uncharacterized protein (DUF736 family)
MRIGIGTKSEEGKFVFTVAAPFLPSAQLTMERNNSEVANAPRYHWFFGGERCGAMWRRTPKEGGESYLSGNIESPLFPGGKIDVAAFVAKTGGEGLMDLVWNVPRQGSNGREVAAGARDDERF